MRTTHLWMAALTLTGCAHRSPPQPAAVAESQTQALSRSERPASDVREIEQPAARAAETPPASESGAAHVQTAAPPPQVATPANAQLAPTSTPADVSIAPPEPANAVVVAAPMRGGVEAAPEPGADISRADAELRERVQRALHNAGSLSYTAKHVQVDVTRRQVTLRGEVRTARERGELEQVVRALPGVKKLNNQVALIDSTGNRPPQP